jgi:hypothetical protein
MQIEIHAAEPLVRDPSPFEVAIGKMENVNHQVELFEAGGEILLSAIHKLVNSTCNKEELPDLWKESIIVPVDKKGDETDCNNYRGISLLSGLYNILWNILV